MYTLHKWQMFSSDRRHTISPKHYIYVYIDRYKIILFLKKALSGVEDSKLYEIGDRKRMCKIKIEI